MLFEKFLDAGLLSGCYDMLGRESSQHHVRGHANGQRDERKNCSGNFLEVHNGYINTGPEKRRVKATPARERERDAIETRARVTTEVNASGKTLAMVLPVSDLNERIKRQALRTTHAGKHVPHPE
jgi:hypothetical protein